MISQTSRGKNYYFSIINRRKKERERERKFQNIHIYAHKRRESGRREFEKHTTLYADFSKPSRLRNNSRISCKNRVRAERSGHSIAMCAGPAAAARFSALMTASAPARRAPPPLLSAEWEKAVEYIYISAYTRVLLENKCVRRNVESFCGSPEISFLFPLKNQLWIRKTN